MMGRVGREGGGGGGSNGGGATAQHRSLALGAALSVAAVAVAVAVVACGWLALRGGTLGPSSRTSKADDSHRRHHDPTGDESPDGEGGAEVEDVLLSKRGQESERRKRRATLEEEMQLNGGKLSIEPIGVVRSVYRLCVGTPRQGLLAPHARGRIDLRVPADAVDGLQLYSHAWVVFVFHLNTLTTNPGKRPAKISPPALGGGTKVGVLSTRSPHRYNPIGISLVRLDRVAGSVLHVSGIDVVDGTPVLDVKPFNPTYDAPPASQLPVRVPSWVETGLEERRVVTFTSAARAQLQNIVATRQTQDKVKNQKHALEFYRDDDDEINLSNITKCIQEVLAMDVRSTFQANKARKGQYQAMRAQRLGAAPPPEATNYDAEASMPYAPSILDKAISQASFVADSQDDTRDSEAKPAATGSARNGASVHDDAAFVVSTQQIDNLLVRYVISPPAAVQQGSSMDNGAEDSVTVVSVEYLESYGDRPTHRK